jgi:hypothetical protein
MLSKSICKSLTDSCVIDVSLNVQNGIGVLLCLKTNCIQLVAIINTFYKMQVDEADFYSVFVCNQ